MEATKPSTEHVVRAQNAGERRVSRLQEYSQQLAALNAIASSVSQSLEFHHTLRTTVEQVPRLMGFEAGLIFLIDKATGDVTLSAHQGLSERIVNLVGRVGLDEELIASVIQTGEPLLGEIPREGIGLLSRHLRQDGFWFFVTIPLRAKGHTLGVMVLASHGPRHLDAGSGHFLLSAGDIIGVALENASLYRDVAQLLEETRRQAEKLRQSEQQFRALIENATDAVAIIQDGRFQYLNRFGQQMLGYSADEVVGLPLLEVIHPDFRDAVARDYHWRLQGETIPPYDITMVRRDGQELPVSLNGCLIEYHQQPAVLLIARDMTEPKLLREQILQSEKMAALGRLISGVAHELNNPLTAVIGYSELLRADGALPPSLREDVDTIYQAADRARKIVQNLLTFARQQRGSKSLVNINEIIERTLRLRAYELKVNNIEVVLELAPHLPPTVADPAQLQQVFLNLIINAEQAMLEAHGKGRLFVRTRHMTTRGRSSGRRGESESRSSPGGGERAATLRTTLEEVGSTSPQPLTDEWIEITFADDGPGIPAAHLHRIFEPFFTTKPVGQGTGLGLSISHSIIQDHGGRIYVAQPFHVPRGKPLGPDSGLSGQPPAGATFIIELPIITDAAASATPTTSSSVEAQTSGRRILIVDDEEIIVSLLRKIVAAEGHQVEAVVSGAEAFARLSERSYDAIICDIRMPDMGGHELYYRVKERDDALAQRIIFVTGDSVSNETRQFLERSGNYYLEKPFLASDLIHILRTLLSQAS